MIETSKLNVNNFHSNTFNLSKISTSYKKTFSSKTINISILGKSTIIYFITQIVNKSISNTNVFNRSNFSIKNFNTSRLCIIKLCDNNVGINNSFYIKIFHRKKPGIRTSKLLFLRRLQIIDKYFTRV